MFLIQSPLPDEGSSIWFTTFCKTSINSLISCLSTVPEELHGGGFGDLKTSRSSRMLSLSYISVLSPTTCLSPSLNFLFASTLTGTRKERIKINSDIKVNCLISFFIFPPKSLVFQNKAFQEKSKNELSHFHCFKHYQRHLA